MAIDRFFHALDEANLETHGVVVMQRGVRVGSAVWAPYALDRPHLLYSLSKSFTAAAVGFAVDEGRFGLDSRVVDFFPQETPKDASDHLLAMRVRDLLAMATGHADEPGGRDGEDWASSFLHHPVPYAPGTHFVYNSLATYMLSTIVQRTTGECLTSFLRPRLFQPLGIKDPVWEQCPRGVDVGGWGLSLSTEEIADFGQLLLEDGRDILPRGWVAEATRSRIDNHVDRSGDWAQGYGYQFWRCRHNAYRGDGAFGQFCIVVPEHQLVVAITGGGGDMQRTLDIVWEHLLEIELEPTGPGEYVLGIPGEPGPPLAWTLWGQDIWSRGDSWTETTFAFPGEPKRPVASRTFRTGETIGIKVVDLEAPRSTVLLKDPDGRVTSRRFGTFLPEVGPSED